MNMSMTVKQEKHDFLISQQQSTERSKKISAGRESIFQRKQLTAERNAIN
jgi:hypothetical protein